VTPTEYPTPLTSSQWREQGDRLGRELLHDVTKSGSVNSHSGPKIQLGLLCAAMALTERGERIEVVDGTGMWIDKAQRLHLADLAAEAERAHDRGVGGSTHGPHFANCSALACVMARAIRFCEPAVIEA
jgi:hypothetical protein